MSIVIHVLSESDLMLLDDYSPDLIEKNPARLKNILWKNGMDVVNHPFEATRPELHRNLRNQVVKNGVLFVGRERLDRQWAQTNCMSTMAVILSTEDPEHIKDLTEMATTVRFEGD